jgi:hypothetical protein
MFLCRGHAVIPTEGKEKILDIKKKPVYHLED